jgi:hypothetical protein
MPNTFNYAERYSDELVDILIQDSLISPFIDTNVRWLDAKTFHFTQMSVSGFKNHNRAGGWNRGELIQRDVPFTLEHDRDIEFLVDKADVDETARTASAENISRTFERTQAVPEANALFFSKVAAKAQAAAGYHSSTATSDYTTDNVLTKLKSYISVGKLSRYKARGSLMMYVKSDIMDKLELCKDLTRTINVETIAEGGAGIETRITRIDGVPILEVIDDECFYDKFNWAGDDGGFEPATGGHKINVLVASLETTRLVPKINSIYFFAPGEHTLGDAWLYQNRSLSDVFTFPNGKDNTIDSVYVDVDTTAVE